MNKLIILLLIFGPKIFAQEAIRTNFISNNEIKINAPRLIGGDLELTYERILNHKSAIGVSIYFLDLDDSDYYIFADVEYFISPYYRVYFGNKYATGFFMEGFAALNSGKSKPILGPEYKTKTDVALGGGVGAKWITKPRLLIEIYIGASKNLFNYKIDESGLGGILKFGVSVGYRF